MEWNYRQPVEIIFGIGSIEKIGAMILDYHRPILITTNSMVKNGIANRLLQQWNGEDIFFDVSANPDVEEVNRCSSYIRAHNNDVIVALGGGSVLDLSKAASLKTLDIREYYGTTKQIPQTHIPVIAIPTTAGTGSEVTSVSVLTDRKYGKKLPIASEQFYPQKAVLDPNLLVTLPKEVTASSGIDVLCHAIEGYWSRNRQPVTNALAVYAIRTILTYLPIAYREPDNLAAREKTAEASVIAGLAFNLPKTTSSHACSFPLTNAYGIPHGEACGMTIDLFLHINQEHPSVKELIKALGYRDAEELIGEIWKLKQAIGLTRGLKEFALDDADIEKLVRRSHHPNLDNNPVPITDEMLCKMYHRLCEY